MNGMEIENCFGKIHISENETIKEIVISTEKHQPRSYVSTTQTVQLSCTPTPSLPQPIHLLRHANTSLTLKSQQGDL